MWSILILQIEILLQMIMHWEQFLEHRYISQDTEEIFVKGIVMINLQITKKTWFVHKLFSLLFGCTKFNIHNFCYHRPWHTNLDISSPLVKFPSPSIWLFKILQFHWLQNYWKITITLPLAFSAWYSRLSLASERKKRIGQGFEIPPMRSTLASSCHFSFCQGA